MVAELRTLAHKWQADAAGMPYTEERGEADALTEAADALLVLIGDREDETSASRQHYIETGQHLPSGHEMRPCGHPEDICPSPGCCTECGGELEWDGSGGYRHA